MISSVLMLLIAVFTTNSCKKWLDVNSNEHATTTIEPGYLFNYAATTFSAARMGADVFMKMSWAAQLMSDGNQWFWGADLYNLGQYPSTAMWDAAFISAGSNLSHALSFAQEDGRLDAQAQCITLRCCVVWAATICFGDVPLSQAWQPTEFSTPQFDAQEDVMWSIVHSLEEAVELIDEDGGGAITDYDIFYGGDMEKWRRAANSLRLRVLLFIANRSADDVAQQVESIITSGDFLTEHSDDFSFPYYDVEGNENPTARFINKFGDYYKRVFMANTSIFEPMSSSGDSRLSTFFVDSQGVGFLAAVGSGEEAVYNDNGTSWDVSDDILETSLVNSDIFFANDYPDMFITASETMLLVAECYVRGLGVGCDMTLANQWYQRAVANNCEYYDVDTEEAETFLSTLTDISTLSMNEAVEAISVQLRIEAMARPLDAWANQRRTGYPTLTVPSYISAIYPAGVIRRLEYPDSEVLSNANVPLVASVSDKSWFEQ